MRRRSDLDVAAIASPPASIAQPIGSQRAWLVQDRAPFSQGSIATATRRATTQVDWRESLGLSGQNECMVNPFDCQETCGWSTREDSVPAPVGGAPPLPVLSNWFAVSIHSIGRIPPDALGFRRAAFLCGRTGFELCSQILQAKRGKKR
jgi:hypothetical protein